MLRFTTSLVDVVQKKQLLVNCWVSCYMLSTSYELRLTARLYSTSGTTSVLVTYELNNQLRFTTLVTRKQNTTCHQRNPAR
jgi:hypothetical protein